MADNNDILKKIRAGNFVENNGKVIRAINLLRHKFIRLKDLRKGLNDLTEQEFLDCVNYLQLKGYVLLRNSTSHAATDIADADYNDLEAKLSDKGIDLSGGFIVDEAVDI